jgi:hypothetical protein
MDNTFFNPNIQLYKTKYFSGLVDSNMLSNALMTKPHEVSPAISYILGMYDTGNVLDFITNGLGNTTTIENNEFEWNVMIEHDKAIMIKQAKWNGATIASTDTPGINNTPITLWLSEKWFGPGAVVAFDDREFVARIAGDPYMDGNDWVYTVYVVGDSNKFIPPSLLAVGKQVSREGSLYEEGSEEADITNYNSPFKLRNRLSTMRLSYEITGSAYASVMVVAVRDPKTKKQTLYWSDFQEWQALRQWYRTIDTWGLRSKYNGNANGVTELKGSNGRPVISGAGILEQISPSNKKSYTKLTLDVLDDFLFDLSYNLKGQGQRNFVALTGEMGMREFDRVLREKASGYQLTDTKFITGSGQELTLGGQFTTYKGLNGISLTLKHYPAYDSTVENRILHPVSGKPIESYRMTFINNSTIDGQANLSKVVRKGREMVMWYTGGAVAPGQGFGKSIGTLRSNAKDAYSVHFLSEQGYMMKDPTQAGELFVDYSSL